MYESPIKIIQKMADDYDEKVEGYVYRVLMHMDISVDRDELMKALEYDRKQYESGYDDGYRRGFIDGYEKRTTEELKDDLQKL